MKIKNIQKKILEFMTQWIGEFFQVQYSYFQKAKKLAKLKKKIIAKQMNFNHNFSKYMLLHPSLIKCAFCSLCMVIQGKDSQKAIQYILQKHIWVILW